MASASELAKLAQQKQYHQPHVTCGRFTCHAAPNATATTAAIAAPLAPVDAKQYDFSAYQSAVDRIFASVPDLTVAYARLEHLCVEFGARISGSDRLESAIDWIEHTMQQQDGLEQVHTEPVMVPTWVRGDESGYVTVEQEEAQAKAEGKEQSQTHATSLPPRRVPLSLLSVGMSRGTDGQELSAPLIVVRDFVELESIESAALATGRVSPLRSSIVLFNYPFTTYSDSVQYRSQGAVRAQAVGAVAVLIRSVCPFSLDTPHTGTMQDADIPAACISIENCELLDRMAKRGKKLRAHIRLDCRLHADRPSRNVVAEIRGRDKPEEVVIVGAHIDSWDVGQGAHDDGQGCMVAWEVVRLLQLLGMQPRRTIRVVLFTDEEVRSTGAAAYLAAHASELEQVVAAMETDLGVFTAIGFGFTGTPAALSMLTHLSALLKPYHADVLVPGEGRGVDIGPMLDAGVPGLLLRFAEEWWFKDYFMFHHTHADTIDKIDPAMLIQNVQVFTAMAYLLAEIPDRLPR